MLAWCLAMAVRGSEDALLDERALRSDTLKMLRGCTVCSESPADMMDVISSCLSGICPQDMQ